jgi:hypothetical protein
VLPRHPLGSSLTFTTVDPLLAVEAGTRAMRSSTLATNLSLLYLTRDTKLCASRRRETLAQITTVADSQACDKWTGVQEWRARTLR